MHTPLSEIVLAPYIQLAMVLIGKRRRVGGNQFRHAMATLSILIDYNIIDPVLLKASVVHDLIEDVKEIKEKDIASIDKDGPEVFKLVLEVTKRPDEIKEAYLERLMKSGSRKAKLLKSADRISNLTDMNLDVYSMDYIQEYLDQTEKYVIPMAHDVNNYMEIELGDLIKIRKNLIKG